MVTNVSRVCHKRIQNLHFALPPAGFRTPKNIRIKHTRMFTFQRYSSNVLVSYSSYISLLTYQCEFLLNPMSSYDYIWPSGVATCSDIDCLVQDCSNSSVLAMEFCSFALRHRYVNDMYLAETTCKRMNNVRHSATVADVDGTPVCQVTITGGVLCSQLVLVTSSILLNMTCTEQLQTNTNKTEVKHTHISMSVSNNWEINAIYVSVVELSFEVLTSFHFELTKVSTRNAENLQKIVYGAHIHL